MDEQEKLEQAIAALEAQRLVLGDAIVDAGIDSIREKINALEMAASGQQRKQVTVLFADISGFTALSEQMDAEDVTETMNALWQQLDKIIVSHNGRIDKHLGDGVMALWGAEQARENDAEQAVLAALEMQKALPPFRKRQGVDLAMRVGLNTGPVLLGQVGTMGEFTAMGDTVNLASRLEQAAKVGTVLISHNTYRHIQGVFDMLPLKPIQVKGKKEPQKVYLVQDAKPYAFRRNVRGVRGIETQMIGRAAELTRLQEALQAVLQGGSLKLVTVLGDAGVGKSRLLYEFNNWRDLLPERIWLFTGRAIQRKKQLPFSLIRDLLSTRFQIQDNDPPAVVQAKLEKGFTSFMGQEGIEKAHLVGYLAGFDFTGSTYIQGIQEDAQQIRDRAFHEMTRFLTAVAARNPVVILLEDIHWADDSSLDLLAHLIRTCVPARLLIVALTRRQLYERRPDWGQNHPDHIQIELSPLSRQESRNLVAEILQQVPQIPQVLQETIVSQAEGNPFYMEELIKMMIEDGVILAEDEQWRVVPDRLATLQVPPTLTGVLQARLDQLSTQEQIVLQMASVVGRIFWDRAVAWLATGADTENQAQDTWPARLEEVTPVLERLQQRETITGRRPAAFTEAYEYMFKHALLHEVVYKQVLKRHRQSYHRLAAGWLVAQSAHQSPDASPSGYTAMIAEHYQLAGDRLLARQWYIRAGEEARRLFANQEAIEHFRQALHTLAATPEEDHGRQRLQIHAALGELLVITSQYDPALEHLNQAYGLASQEQDSGRRATICRWLARLYELRGEYESAFEWIETGLTILKGRQTTEVVELRLVRGLIYFRQGDFERAEEDAETAVPLAEQLNERRSLARVNNLLGIICLRYGNFPKAGTHFQHALALYQETNDIQGQALSHNGLANMFIASGQWRKAEQHFRFASAAFEQIGDIFHQASTYNNLAVIPRNQGRFDEALQFYGQALQSFEQIGAATSILGIVHMNLGATYALQGVVEQAQEQLATAQTCFEQDNAQDFLAELQRHKARIALQQGQLAEAETLARSACQLAQEMALRAECGVALGLLAEIVYQRAQPGQARQPLEESIAILTEVADEYELARSRLLLAKIALSEGAYDEAAGLLEQATAVFQQLEAQIDLDQAAAIRQQLAAEVNDE